MDWDTWARSQTTADSVGMLQRLQGLQQNHKITELQLQQLAALERLQRSIDEEASKTKCPWCGGGLEQGYEFCKYCSNQVVWVGHLVGKPEQEPELQTAYQKWQVQQEQRRIAEERRKQRQKKQDAKLARERREESARLQAKREEYERSDEYKWIKSQWKTAGYSKWIKSQWKTAGYSWIFVIFLLVTLGFLKLLLLVTG